MKIYTVLPEYADAWASDNTYPVVVTDAEIDRLAAEWETDRGELMNQVEEFAGRYMIIVASNSSHGRVYYSDSRDAMKAAREHGLCEGGEEIRIYDRRGKCLSGVNWTSEDGGKYYRVVV